MKKMKIPSLIFGAIFLFLIFLFPIKTALAADNLNIYFFWGEGCPHCVKEKEFLKEIKKDYPNINIYDFEIYNNSDNSSLLKKISRELKMRVDGIPFTIIGDQQFVGFSENLTPNNLKNRIEYCLSNQCPDNTAKIIGVQSLDNIPNGKDEIKGEINLPFIGKINPYSFSLPILTIIMGGLDGFNPCAMWTLLFLISILLGMKDRKKMWILGITFIVASALVYFLFMAAWLNLILFLGFIVWIRILIGIIALLGGVYSLKEFTLNKNNVCKVAGEEKKQKIFDKLKLAVQQKSLWLAIGGIIILAFSVNLIELICSAGLPAVYTQILTLNQIAKWQYYFYILLYIFFFMLDDLLVFFVAMTTLKITGITTKYTKISRLVGGLAMLAIGLMLIFKPSWLMFG